MEDKEFEVEYYPYMIGMKLPVNGKQDYWLYDWQNNKSTPEWTEFDQFIAEMKDYLMKNVPKKAESVNLKPRQDNIGGFTNFAVGQHVERTKDGGNV